MFVMRMKAVDQILMRYFFCIPISKDFHQSFRTYKMLILQIPVESAHTGCVNRKAGPALRLFELIARPDLFGNIIAKYQDTIRFTGCIFKYLANEVDKNLFDTRPPIKLEQHFPAYEWFPGLEY